LSVPTEPAPEIHSDALPAVATAPDVPTVPAPRFPVTTVVPLAPAAAPTVRARPAGRTGAQLAAAGGVTVLLGAFLPWVSPVVTFPTPDGPAAPVFSSGIESGPAGLGVLAVGVLITVAALVLLTGARPRAALSAAVLPLAGAAAVLTVLDLPADLTSAGIGRYAVLLGALLAVVGAVRARSRSRA
jgi:hypothetical protein